MGGQQIELGIVNIGGQDWQVILHLSPGAKNASQVEGIKDELLNYVQQIIDSYKDNDACDWGKMCIRYIDDHGMYSDGSSRVQPVDKVKNIWEAFIHFVKYPTDIKL